MNNHIYQADRPVNDLQLLDLGFVFRENVLGRDLYHNFRSIIISRCGGNHFCIVEGRKKKVFDGDIETQGKLIKVLKRLRILDRIRN